MALLDAKLSKPLDGGPSYDIRHRIFRMGWNLCWALLAAWTPAPLHAWRRFLLRRFGATLSPSARVYGSAKVWYPPNLVMHDNACLGPGATCYSMATVTLEKGALVSQGAYLCCGTHDVDDAHFQLQVAPIVIGEDAWIAAEAFVGPGVTVGARAVIGARCVVFKNAESGGIYVGNPARLVRMRGHVHG